MNDDHNPHQNSPHNHPNLRRHFAQNPSLTGLYLGMILGLLNSVLFVGVVGAINRDAFDPVFLFWSLSSGFFLGLFAGGLIGLYCHWRARPFSSLLAGLIALESVAGLLIIAAMIAAFSQQGR